MLVYSAVATDARPDDGTGSSDAFFIEISRLGAAAGDAFTLPGGGDALRAEPADADRQDRTAAAAPGVDAGRRASTRRR